MCTSKRRQQLWFRKLWAVQFVPPLDAAWVCNNHIKTSVPYEEDEEAIAEDPERVDQFNEALDNMVTCLSRLGWASQDLMALAGSQGFLSAPGQFMSLSLRTSSSVRIVQNLGTPFLN